MEANAISLPDPKIIGARNLVHSAVFDPGNLAMDVHSAQELRGAMNHLSCTSRVWSWLTEPINQIMSLTDRNKV